LGIDFDDTIADFSELMARIARERWGVDMRALRAKGRRLVDAIGQEASDSLFIEILETDASLEMAPKPGALEALRRLSEQHELVIVTARHEHESEAPRRWLQRHELRVTEFIATNRAPKSTFAETHELAIHLDDTPSVFDHFVDHATLSALYVDAAWPRARDPESPLPAHIREIEHWRRFERLVAELAAADPVAGAAER
jgi:hypothetical protein